MPKPSRATMWALAAPISGRALPAEYTREAKRPRQRRVSLPPIAAEYALTLVCLAIHADDDGITWVSAAKLAAERDMYPAGIHRHLKALVSAGYIAELEPAAIAGTRAGTNYAKRTRYKPRIWRLSLETLSSDETNKSSSDESGHSSSDETHGFSSHETTLEEPVEESREGEEEMTSAAQRDLGYLDADDALASPRERDYPKQCDDHQYGVHRDNCGKCGSARREYEAAEKARAEAIAAAKAEARRLMTLCEACSDDGWTVTAGPARRCTHPGVAA